MVLVPLRNKILSYTDVITIIEMRDDADVICYMEPVSIALYNKLVDLTLKDIKDIGGQGNYIPSLLMAEYILEETKQANCAKFLLFLSDGRPSD